MILFGIKGQRQIQNSYPVIHVYTTCGGTSWWVCGINYPKNKSKHMIIVILFIVMRMHPPQNLIILFKLYQT